ncbi:MAG: helix-turn-helix transcriptional regulator [Veillonellaceae bacterium]|nr:helix-turn-helix transcriptional regulator [Veillonellaceae bacterium]
MPVIENIRRIREAKGVSKTFVAKHLGLTLQGYRYIESGEVKLDVERMKKIGRILNVDSSIFLKDELTDCVIKELQAV